MMRGKVEERNVARGIVRGAVCCASVLWAGQAALAQSAADYPAKPVRVVLGQAPGGGTDIQARLFAQKLSESIGRTFVVENRTGAGSVLSFRHVAAANPDGYTLLAVSGGFTIAPAVRKDLGFDPIKDLAPISLLVESPFLLLVHPSLPVKNVKEYIALAKKKPNELTYGSAGQASSTHMAFALFTTLADIDVTHVPYKGTGPALIDAMGGQVHSLMGNVLSSLQHVRSGKLRALAVSTAKRSTASPDLPTLAEAGVPGYESSTWHAWFAPAGTPGAIIARLNAELIKATKAPEVVARLAPDGSEPVGSTPEHLRQFVVTDIARWRKVVQRAGITLQ
jgi:tripartite-type tricarboxylate transporter receptor subunit TctC